MTNTSQAALFDIKVALLGSISAGKTTLLNALLGDEYGFCKNSTEAATTTATCERTTTEITYYRLVAASDDDVPIRPPGTTAGAEASQQQRIAGTSTAVSFDSYYPPSNITSVQGMASTLWDPQLQGEKERSTSLAKHQQQQEHYQQLAQQSMPDHESNSKTNNREKRDSTSVVRERHIEVPLIQELFVMRPDTQLVFVDVPGLDCSRTSSLAKTTYHCPYTQYVQHHWESFDCILVVLDVTAPQSAQDNLLEFIQETLDSKLRLPVLCLWNKVDDPYDPKALTMIQQTQNLVNLILRGPNKHPTTTKAPPPPPRNGTTVPLRLLSVLSGESSNPSHHPANGFNTSAIMAESKSNADIGFGPPMTTDNATTDTNNKNSVSNQPLFAFGTDHKNNNKANGVFRARNNDPYGSPENSQQNGMFSNSSKLQSRPSRPPPVATATSFQPLAPAPTSTNNAATTTIIVPPTTKQETPLLFLPLSAKEALVYKRVANMGSVDDFELYLQHDWMVERLGRDQIGLRRWNRLSRQDQIQESYYMLKDPAEYERALDACGYTAFERALGELVGNINGAQTTILETRMEFSLRTLLDPDHPLIGGASGMDREGLPSGSSTTLLAPQLYSVYTKFQVLYGETQAAQYLPQELQTAFWAAYDKMEIRALKTVLGGGLLQVNALAEPIDQLLSYYTVAKRLGWENSSSDSGNSSTGTMIAKRMRHLFLQFLQLLLEQEAVYDYDAWGDHFQSTSQQRGNEATSHDGRNSNNNPWAFISPKDWMHVWSSLLLLSYNRYFCQQFGREKMLLDDLLEKARSSWKTYSKMALRICPHCSEPLQPVQNEWRCHACKFALFTCFPSTLCNGCGKHRFQEPKETDHGLFGFGGPGGPSEELHVCPGNGFTYSPQQALQVWMRTFYNCSHELVPNYPNLYNRVVQLGDIPERLSDPSHAGYILYQYCNLRELVENEQVQSIV